MRRLFGVPADAAIDRYDIVLARIHDEDRATVDELVKRAFVVGDYDAAFRVVHPDGVTHVIAARGVVHYDAGGQPARMIGVCWDGTEERRAAEALRQSEAGYRGREGIVAVLSITIPQPPFQGQTKERLNNTEVTPVIDGIIRTAVENALNANRTAGDVIANRVILASRARSASRAAAEQVTRKSAISHRLNLPGKLADCSSTDPNECELFIVEGDSAKQGRERKFQAILPLRGKVLNTEQASTVKVLGNKELADIVSALGCGAGKDFDAKKLRYHKICLLIQPNLWDGSIGTNRILLYATV